MFKTNTECPPLSGRARLCLEDQITAPRLSDTRDNCKRCDSARSLRASDCFLLFCFIYEVHGMRNVHAEWIEIETATEHSSFTTSI